MKEKEQDASTHQNQLKGYRPPLIRAAGNCCRRKPDTPGKAAAARLRRTMEQRISIRHKFAAYVSKDIFGMIGISAYVLADTFFIALAEGADGIAALNLVLPVYGLIYAVGAMIGAGAATRFAIDRVRRKESEGYLSEAVEWILIASVPFILIGAFLPERLLILLGATGNVIAAGTDYSRIFLLFTPLFMLNYAATSFTRNDADPTLSMAATIASSLFNIAGDYVLMFPLHLGMSGAALATALSPLLSISICMAHLKKPGNTLVLRKCALSVRRLLSFCRIGVSAFVAEISGGFTTLIFNFLILGIAGNTGVAAYGVVANTAIVANSVFNGISQGAQPLLSDSCARGQNKETGRILRMAVLTALFFAVVISVFMLADAPAVSGVFNTEGDSALSAIAVPGLRIYFAGYVFAGFNIVCMGYFAATDRGREAFTTSILRGFVIISLMAYTLSKVLGMNGIWLSFPVAEALLSAIIILMIRRNHRQLKRR